VKEIRARRADLSDVAELRGQYRSKARCQIVRDSILPRGLADPYLLEADGRVAGYAGVWNKHFLDRITELFVLPSFRRLAPVLVRSLSEASGARELEVQTNILDGRELLEECATRIRVENLLFETGPDTALDRPDLVFRRRGQDDVGPAGEWVVEKDGRVVAGGGWLTHYNPPHADLYLKVIEGVRGQGVGSYLVQELRRACEADGWAPAARCDPSNEASRRALLRGGLRPCGEILVGSLRTTEVRGS
jgi:GNAT superfamily N-acetyltransferase